MSPSAIMSITRDKELDHLFPTCTHGAQPLPRETLQTELRIMERTEDGGESLRPVRERRPSFLSALLGKQKRNGAGKRRDKAMTSIFQQILQDSDNCMMLKIEVFLGLTSHYNLSLTKSSSHFTLRRLKHTFSSSKSFATPKCRSRASRSHILFQVPTSRRKRARHSLDESLCL